jgi:hypothetical protein
VKQVGSVEPDGPSPWQQSCPCEQQETPQHVWEGVQATPLHVDVWHEPLQ